MLISRYHNTFAKTSHGGQSLYDHTFQCVETAVRLAHFTPDYPQTKLDVLILGVCIHDVGKLDPTFQAMLHAKLGGPAFSGRPVKHEGCSFGHDHIPLVENSFSEIKTELKSAYSYDLDLNHLTTEGLEWAWACAVTHHGMYYLSYEQNGTNHLKRQVRRQWTTFAPLEVRRLTLVDLLFHFHPLGGLVILADQIASHAFEKGYDLDLVFRHTKSLTDVFNRVISVADETEASLKQDDPRNYNLREMLQLLAGSCI